MSTQPNQIVLKVVLSGNHGVGKTSLLTRQTFKEFSQNRMTTIGVDFKIKMYKVGSLNVKTQIWDRVGAERFKSMLSLYYKGAKAILLCFDLNDSNSFKNLEDEMAHIQNMKLNGCRVYLIGCKSDLEPKVFAGQILTIAQRLQCAYFQTSAKQNKGVNECFEVIMNECAMDKIQEKAFSKIHIESKPVESKGIKKTCF